MFTISHPVEIQPIKSAQSALSTEYVVLSTNKITVVNNKNICIIFLFIYLPQSSNLYRMGKWSLEMKKIFFLISELTKIISVFLRVKEPDILMRPLLRLNIYGWWQRWDPSIALGRVIFPQSDQRHDQVKASSGWSRLIRARNEIRRPVVTWRLQGWCMISRP